jgi:hypothetical protein
VSLNITDDRLRARDGGDRRDKFDAFYIGNKIAFFMIIRLILIEVAVKSCCVSLNLVTANEGLWRRNMASSVSGAVGRS